MSFLLCLRDPPCTIKMIRKLERKLVRNKKKGCESQTRTKSMGLNMVQQKLMDMALACSCQSAGIIPMVLSMNLDPACSTLLGDNLCNLQHLHSRCSVSRGVHD